ncbi:hypothetical protein SAY87_005055 [Trapa incisa]|uniref:Uncharacterized protein n=1 Tax=Trapa incisa TaxID=236973 RepID=A0AAN7JQR8_9MYRT|nr:hypothetical protein SAY87_005055 [Trapa incisa]
MDPPPALTAPEHEEDEWDKDGFVIPSLEIEGAVPAEQDDPNSQTLVATSQMAKKEESIYLGPHGAPPSMSKQQSSNSSNNRKQRFKQKLREAEKKFGGGSGRENKVENLRELVGGGARARDGTRLPNPNMSKASPRDWLDPHCLESQFEKLH